MLSQGPANTDNSTHLAAIANTPLPPLLPLPALPLPMLPRGAHSELASKLQSTVQDVCVVASLMLRHVSASCCGKSKTRRRRQKKHAVGSVVAVNSTTTALTAPCTADIDAHANTDTSPPPRPTLALPLAPPAASLPPLALRPSRVRRAPQRLLNKL